MLARIPTRPIDHRRIVCRNRGIRASGEQRLGHARVRRIDVGFLWGPIAGYYRKHDDLPITLVPLPSEPGAARMEYHITMGVRANEPEWRRRINAAILKRQGEITAILRDYGVPLLNEQGELITP